MSSLTGFDERENLTPTLEQGHTSPSPHYPGQHRLFRPMPLHRGFGFGVQVLEDLARGKVQVRSAREILQKLEASVEEEKVSVSPASLTMSSEEVTPGIGESEALLPQGNVTDCVAFRDEIFSASAVSEEVQAPQKTFSFEEKSLPDFSSSVPTEMFGSESDNSDSALRTHIENDESSEAFEKLLSRNNPVAQHVSTVALNETFPSPGLSALPENNTVLSSAVETSDELLHRGQVTGKSIKVTRGRALSAWLLDGFVFSCTLILSFSIVSVYSPAAFNTFLLETLNPFMGHLPVFAEFGHDIVWGLQIISLSLMLIFVLQFCVGIMFGSSLGRFALGIAPHPGKYSLFHTCFRGVAIAFSEAMTLGGILTLPMILAFPSRLPIMPLMRLN